MGRDAKAQQLLKTAMEHPGVDKETLREALLDSVRQMVEEVRVEPSPMTAGKEVLSNLAPKPASKKGKTGSSKKWVGGWRLVGKGLHHTSFTRAIHPS